MQERYVKAMKHDDKHKKEEEGVQEEVEGTGERNRGWEVGAYGEDEAVEKNENGGRGQRSGSCELHIGIP